MFDCLVSTCLVDDRYNLVAREHNSLYTDFQSVRGVLRHNSYSQFSTAAHFGVHAFESYL